MRWSNLLVIFRREVRDQIRDRRTLFMIFVLPILLYPILGIGVVQFAAALEQKPRVVVVVGAEYLPKSPPLLNPSGDGFNPASSTRPPRPSGWSCSTEPASGPWGDPQRARAGDPDGAASAVMVIPADLPEQLQREQEIDIPIKYNSVDEPSQITYLRLKEVLSRWRKSIVAGRLKRDQKTESYTEPIQVKAEDVATASEVGGSVWSRLFPFLLVMMSLTGAFYPAIDLCAGEKERGTMETLLISPASRAEIVLGKFLTVMLASVMTALLNLVSMGLTGLQLARQVGASLGRCRAGRAVAAIIAPPTLQAAFWMILLLIPLAAFFSAVCLALAVLARSMKEGQYYMTPLYLVCLPLIFLTLTPGIELDLFYSLVPITGVALLLRALILGNYDVALRYFLPCWCRLVYAAVALRWAIDQFQREDVLVPRGRAIQPVFLVPAPLPRPRADADRRPGALVLRPDPDLVVVLDAVPGVSGGESRSGQRGRRPARHPDSARVDGDPAHLGPGADACGSPGPSRGTSFWPSRWSSRSTRWSTSCGRSSSGSFPISSMIKTSLAQMMAQAPSLAVIDRRLRPDPGDLRGVRVSRLHPFRAGAPAPDPLGDPALGPDVRVSPRAA